MQWKEENTTTCMASLNIYDKCQSRKLIAMFKHDGPISYREGQRGCCSLAQYTLQHCNNVDIPLSSHFFNNMVEGDAIKFI